MFPPDGNGRLANKRVLVTQANAYMGPPIVDLFTRQGAEVTADTSDLTGADAAAACVQRAGELDILVANLAIGPRPARADEQTDEDWYALFDALVHPLMSLVRAALPQMIARKRGKIVAVTSAAPLRGIPGVSGYCAARGAQNAFLRSVALEVAEHNVQVNAIAQNYVRNDTYYPDDLVASERFQKHLARNVPAKRIGSPEETAELALFLASEKSDFIVGQILPLAGGWA